MEVSVPVAVAVDVLVSAKAKLEYAQAIQKERKTRWLFWETPTRRKSKPPVAAVGGRDKSDPCSTLSALSKGARWTGDAMPVSWSPAQGAQNQHVERAINKFDAVSGRLLRHGGR